MNCGFYENTARLHALMVAPLLFACLDGCHRGPELDEKEICVSGGSKSGTCTGEYDMVGVDLTCPPMFVPSGMRGYCGFERPVGAEIRAFG